MATGKSIPPKFDYSGIDTRAIDPDRLSLGTNAQDCGLIAATYERGAHSTPTESAIFSTFSRSLQNRKQFALSAVQSLSSYNITASQTGASALSASSGIPSINLVTASAASVIPDNSLQSLNVGTQQSATYNQNFGSQLLDYAKKCIPCDLRMVAFLELHPHLDLLAGMNDFIKNSIKLFNDLLDMLNNLNEYADFCSLLNMLSFMCIPDLQRIIALLMSLFLSIATSLDGMIGMLQALIAPFFSGILMAITSLLDQFSLLVVNPLECVISAIRTQLQSRGLEYGYYAPSSSLNPSDPNTQIGGGLAMLNNQLIDGSNKIKNKMAFYISQIKAMMGELGTGDAAYLQSKMQALTLVRMIAFVIAIITALSKGHAACSSSKTPEQSELDNFFQNFLGPQTPFNIYTGPDGQIHVDEKMPVDISPLSDTGNMVQFDGQPLIDPMVIQRLQQKLVEPIRIAPCKLEVTVDNATQINNWIAELNKA